jgi:hypothetical protein
MTIMRSIFLAAFGISTLTTLVALASTNAAATSGFVSYSATTCVNSEFNGSSGHALENGQVVNTLPTNSLIDYCPVVNDSVSAPTRQATNVDLYGWSQGANRLSLAACRTSITGGAGVCGTTANSAASGVQDVSASTAVWNSGGPVDGYYLVVTFGPGSAIFSYAFLHS